MPMIHQAIYRIVHELIWSQVLGQKALMSFQVKKIFATKLATICSLLPAATSLKHRSRRLPLSATMAQLLSQILSICLALLLVALAVPLLAMSKRLIVKPRHLQTPMNPVQALLNVRIKSLIRTVAPAEAMVANNQPIRQQEAMAIGLPLCRTKTFPSRLILQLLPHKATMLLLWPIRI